MATKKCPVCGCTELVPYQFAEYVISEFNPFMDAFMCADCGRIEFYAHENKRKKCIDNARARMAEEKDRTTQLLDLEPQLAELKSELDRCNAIVNDENQTVKAVRDAESRALELSKEITNLEAKIKVIKRGESVPGVIIGSDYTYHS